MSHVLYPFTFQPIFKDRVWGGRKLEQLYGKAREDKFSKPKPLVDPNSD